MRASAREFHVVVSRMLLRAEAVHGMVHASCDAALAGVVAGAPVLERLIDDFEALGKPLAPPVQRGTQVDFRGMNGLFATTFMRDVVLSATAGRATPFRVRGVHSPETMLGVGVLVARHGVRAAVAVRVADGSWAVAGPDGCVDAHALPASASAVLTAPGEPVDCCRVLLEGSVHAGRGSSGAGELGAAWRRALAVGVPVDPDVWWRSWDIGAEVLSPASDASFLDAGILPGSDQAHHH